MTKKLYSVREITEMLNQHMAENAIDYRFTEDRVRARLRYAQSKGEITPKKMLYDKRASYYTDDDLDRLQRDWIGQLLGEGEVLATQADRVEANEPLVVIRKATINDSDMVLHLLSARAPAGSVLKNHFLKLVRSLREHTIVAIGEKQQVIGWSHAALSPPAGLLMGTLTGVMHLAVNLTVEDPAAVATLLLQSGQHWLADHNASQILVYYPASHSDLTATLQAQGYQHDTSRLTLCKTLESWAQDY